jgi:hypothetical protein
MLTFILIGGLVWLVVALMFVLALAAAARKQVSPVTVNNPGESVEQEISSPVVAEESPSSTPHSIPLHEPIAT